MTSIRMATLVVASVLVLLSVPHALGGQSGETPGERLLRVELKGDGAGTVTSKPRGLSCPKTCSARFALDAEVVLTASAEEGSIFAGWGGPCGDAEGKEVCTISRASRRAVTARFEPSPTVALRVEIEGRGAGKVTSRPEGINCSSRCSARFEPGTTVTLTPSPKPGSTFAGWSGSCAGMGACALTLSAATKATATFQPAEVRARLVRWQTVREPKGRTTRVTILAREVVGFTIRVVRWPRIVVSREVSDFGPGERVVALPIPARARAGKARLQVTFIDRFGTTKSQAGSVEIPPLR